METSTSERHPSIGYQFKSYYVVWKRFEAEKKEKYKKCLNRTM